MKQNTLTDNEIMFPLQSYFIYSLELLFDFLRGTDIILKFPLVVTPIIMVIGQRLELNLGDRLAVSVFLRF